MNSTLVEKLVSMLPASGKGLFNSWMDQCQFDDDRNGPLSEPSATIVWKVLYRFGVAEETILWNALQMHPFRDLDPRSNRTPTDDEVAAGADALRCLRETYPTAKLIAVGRKAEHAAAWKRQN